MKVAFFHPYKMADHYFVEAIEAAMIADLCADGHEAEAAEYLFEPSRDEETQIREVREALLRERYDVVFLERPWSDAMVRALSGLRVVAYARPEMVERGLVDVGVIDTTRDVVRRLVRALAANEPLASVPGIVFREGGTVRRNAGNRALSVLRELGDASFDHARRRALSRSSANPERAVVLSNLGCAYRNVPNRTGVFDGVAMPDDVSTAGCTFCSASAYERMTEGDAIDLIVRQVTAVLRDRPGIKEIAIKDDYAVRFLGRLGDALRPLGVGDKRVLLSARAEYLLEFRGEIEDALSGRFPAPLGFYLIGFENFSQAELTRFHKGMNAQQIEKVIVLIREWSERFPGRFHVAPTGGFILFTPWTTIEDLRINASAMRRLDFERHRGGALLSQLRLYPNLPLYWLAKKDGLLTSAFEREEMSDAHRRGYEADHPWRFSDAKVAEVYRKLLDAKGLSAPEMFEVFEDALDEAAGVAKGKKNRPLRMVRAPSDTGKIAPATRNVTLNRACNQTCGFCTYRASGPEPPNAPKDASRMRAAKAIQSVRAAAAEGTRTLVVTGAEPTLEWYLADLVRLARDLGIAEVVLETNGTLVTEESARALSAAGVTRAVVAFNSMDPRVSDAITRDPGGHARTVRGVRALLAAGIPVELSVALLLENRGALASIAAGVKEAFPKTAAGVEGIVARYITASPRHPRALPVRLAARELASGHRAGESSGVVVRVAPGGELPPCVFDDPVSARGVMRLSEVIVTRDNGTYERIPACATCAASGVCPGPIKPAAAAVAATARPIAEDRSAGLVPVSNTRARVLSEYRSQFFLEAPEGGVKERRIVRVNFHCNQACDFCFVSRELPQVEHDLVVKEITEAAEKKAILDLSGGEPTLNPRLQEYIALARDLGVPELELQTNAVKMADPEYAQSLFDAGLRQAFVSLHGITAKVSDRVTAAPGTFDRTIQGIRNLRALGVQVRLNFVLCGYNVEELARLPDYVAREIQGDREGPKLDINFSFVAASTDNVPRDTGLIPRFSDVAWALAAAHERASALGISMTGFDSKCGVPACYMPRAIREEHFARPIPAEELARAKGFAKSEACSKCEFDDRCYGIRGSYAQLYGLSELRPIVKGEVVPVVTAAAVPGSVPVGEDARSSVWTAIGLAPSHVLRPGSAERLTDNGSFARHPRPWIDGLDASHDREVVQLEGGLRKVLKVERGSASAAEETAANFRARGFSAGVYIGPPGPGGSSRRAMAFIGKTEEAVREALEIEPGLTASFRERAILVKRMGELLGYPACCVEALASSKEQDDNTHLMRLAAAHPGPMAPHQNWAATPIRPFSHFPCTPDCGATARLAIATLALMTPSYRAAVEKALRSVAIVSAADRFALLMGARAEGPGTYVYDGVLSHRNLGMDDSILARPAFRAFYLEVVAPLEEGDRVTRTGVSLLVRRGERRIGEIVFAGPAPNLLDFTGDRAIRRLPLAAPAG